jgi:hypothetical protein
MAVSIQNPQEQSTMSDQYSNSRTDFPILKAAASNAVRITDGGRPHWSLRTLAVRGFNGMMSAIPAFLGLGDDAISIGSERVGQATPLRAESARTGAFVTLDQLEQLCKAEPGNYLVEGLLPADDVHIAVGDSGLGKTPWAYQLGLCVAAGRPFLDREVKQGRVLYFDLENGGEAILEMTRSICEHLRIEQFPPDFFVFHDEGETPSLKVIPKLEPVLVIIDTLRAFRPEIEKANDDTGRFLQEARSLARANHCAILFLHHVRKPGADGIPPLHETPALEWLLEAAGARALINQTTARIAFDRPRRANVNDAAFVMKYFVKTKGEGGPIYLERVCNQEGEPIGYEAMAGVHLLGDADQQAPFLRLPQGQFSFKEAKFIYGKSDDPTRKWLLKCMDASLVKQVGRGLYERIA